MSDEDRLRECQAEIRRLRAIVRENDKSQQNVFLCRLLNIDAAEPEYIIGVFSSVENAKKALRLLQEEENLGTLVSGVDYEIDDYAVDHYRWQYGLKFEHLNNETL
jgi:hypothetical protein